MARSTRGPSAWLRRAFPLIVVAAALVSSCSSSQSAMTIIPDGGDAAAASVTPEASPTPQAIATPELTPNPRARPTLLPLIVLTPTPEPSATAEVTATATPIATPTATSNGTATADPSVTPAVTATPIPTATPELTPTVEAAPAGGGATPRPSVTPQPTANPTITPQPTITPLPTRDPATPTPGPTPTPIPRLVVDQSPAPFATINGVAVMLPATRIERIGFHQAGHTGSQQMATVESGVRYTEMDDRSRGTGSHTAADIVVDPAVPIYAPVSGRVFAANNYVLYCQYTDDLVFIEPDGLPGFELKIFHIQGLQVGIGDYVVAGQTIIANGSRLLPFASQVDEFTASPAWPHVHIEVVDPSIPDERPAGGGCP